MSKAEARALLEEMFHRAIDGVRDPARLTAALPPPPPGRVIVLAAGKAACAMAQIVEEVWPGPVCGLAVTPPGYGLPLKHMDHAVGGHPIPDESSVASARRFLSLAQDLGADDLALVLLSGGGSALLTLPAPGLTLADKQEVTRALFAAGADIHAINCVRRHLSAIKGGRLARAAYPARVVTCAISDVAGDTPGDIASGPTTGDATTRAEALQILGQYRVPIREKIRAWLASPEAETPKPADPDMTAVTFRVVASGRQALDAAAALARQQGFRVHDLGDRIAGDARVIAREHARRARELVTGEGRHLILSGGEVTVTLGKKEPGQGGPNREYALALALQLNGHPAIAALAADTDGLDGTGPAAGAFVFPDTLERACRSGLDAAHMLNDHASGAFFDRLGDSFVTGPTRTNVNDFRAILIDD